MMKASQSTLPWQSCRCWLHYPGWWAASKWVHSVFVAPPAGTDWQLTTTAGEITRTCLHWRNSVFYFIQDTFLPSFFITCEYFSSLFIKTETRTVSWVSSLAKLSTPHIWNWWWRIKWFNLSNIHCIVQTVSTLTSSESCDGAWKQFYNAIDRYNGL